VCALEFTNDSSKPGKTKAEVVISNKVRDMHVYIYIYIGI